MFIRREHQTVTLKLPFENRPSWFSSSPHLPVLPAMFISLRPPFNYLPCFNPNIKVIDTVAPFPKKEEKKKRLHQSHRRIQSDPWNDAVAAQARIQRSVSTWLLPHPSSFLFFCQCQTFLFSLLTLKVFLDSVLVDNQISGAASKNTRM